MAGSSRAIGPIIGFREMMHPIECPCDEFRSRKHEDWRKPILKVCRSEGNQKGFGPPC